MIEYYRGCETAPLYQDHPGLDLRITKIEITTKLL